MVDTLKKQLKEFRKNCSGEKCDSCDLGNIEIDGGELKWHICSLLSEIESKLNEE